MGGWWVFSESKFFFRKKLSRHYFFYKNYFWRHKVISEYLFCPCQRHKFCFHQICWHIVSPKKSTYPPHPLKSLIPPKQELTTTHNVYKWYKYLLNGPWIYKLSVEYIINNIIPILHTTSDLKRGHFREKSRILVRSTYTKSVKIKNLSMTIKTFSIVVTWHIPLLYIYQTEN